MTVAFVCIPSLSLRTFSIKPMSKNLVIVESPAKAKTIEGYLGKDFIVKSSYGHIRDLPKGSESVDVANGFEPKYVVSDDKKQLVKELQKADIHFKTLS